MTDATAGGSTRQDRRHRTRVALGAGCALLAFAANSLLCRAALGTGATGTAALGPAAFTIVRLVAGAFTLLLLQRPWRVGRGLGGTGLGAAMLAIYLLGFSYAYVELATGTGALILFGSVQMTMLGFAVARGNRPSGREWIGTVIAFGGLVYLVTPSLDAPSSRGAALMIAAGIGWGAYTLLGRGSRSPLRDTAGNFTRALPAVAVLGILHSTMTHVAITAVGVALAASSGALTSGIGYAIWYAVLPGLTATRAALLQLAVPALAAVGGVLVLGESMTMRLWVAMILVLGGIAFAIRARR